ncbi:MAG: DUF881 domain-containing protein, partial [Oscillospiraceae bacterium]|nr:DUF881 domain-containing protein [Oscillospiraceae bacterium]
MTLEAMEGVQIEPRDLLTLLNELRLAGAEAISINNERIVHNSYVVSIGDLHISVNGRRVIPPFTVRAIGNPAH